MLNIKNCTKFVKRNAVILLIGTLCIIIPLLFTNGLSTVHADRGIYGDWWGGTTAPFIGLFGSILIYISFLEQVNANKHLKDEKNRIIFFKRYDEINKLIHETYAQFLEYSRKERNDSLTKHYRYFLSSIDSNFQLIANFTDNADTNEGRKKLTENSDDLFSFKNLLRDKLMHYYEMEYALFIEEILSKIPTHEKTLEIIESLRLLKKEDQAITNLENQINNSLDLQTKRKELESEINDIQSKIIDLNPIIVDTDICFILMSIKNIIEVIILKKSDFWGEKDLTQQ